MDIQTKTIQTSGIKLFFLQDNREVARAYLYIMNNDLHQQPFALLEDLYVEEQFRGKGIGAQFVQQAIAEARSRGCYKLICTSRQGREELHQWYIKLGFTDHGREFRMDFK